MDMAMPGLNGVQATREILKHEPTTAVLIPNMYSEENHARNALDADARGYMLKEAWDVDLAGAVKTLAAGRQVIGTGVLAPNPAPDPRFERLSPREKQILDVAQGKTNKVIASLFNMSENTVSVHRANIMEELGIHRATELILWAAKNGLVHLP